MATFETAHRFDSDRKKLTDTQHRRFVKVVQEQFVPDIDAGSFRPALRVKGVKGRSGVFEMTWAPDGRATWMFGAQQRAGVTHVIWRRVGTHDIFRDP